MHILILNKSGCPSSLLLGMKQYIFNFFFSFLLVDTGRTLSECHLSVALDHCSGLHLVPPL